MIFAHGLRKMKRAKSEKSPDRDVYMRQNKAIHKARMQLGMTLDDCRELARQIGGKASLSALSLEYRRELIKELNAKGAKVFNPPIVKDAHKELYYERLEFWDKRFPRGRREFCSNRQLALIETLWDLDFNDGRTDSRKGLRGFIWRQTESLKDGPVSDITFLKDHHISSVLTPLKAKARQNAA